MTMTCANCGYSNTMANDSSAVCPNCGTFYSLSGQTEPSQTAILPPNPSMLTPPPALNTPTSPPGLYAYPSSTFSPNPPPAPRASGGNRRNIVLGAIAGVVVAALLAGVFFVIATHAGGPVAATATATPAAPTFTPAPSVQAVLYSDPNGLFTMKYPSTWQVTPSTGTLGGASANLTEFAPMTKGHNGVLVIVGTGFSLQNLGEVVTQTFQGTAYQQAVTPTTLTLHNHAWQVMGGTFTAKSGVMAGLDAAYLQSGTHSFLVIGYGGAKQYGQGKNKTWLAMLRTFMPKG